MHSCVNVKSLRDQECNLAAKQTGVPQHPYNIIDGIQPNSTLVNACGIQTKCSDYVENDNL